MINTIHKTLLEMAEPEYQKFSSKLLPEVNNILGVRLPKLRKYSRQVWKEYGSTYLEETLCEEYRKSHRNETMEEILLQGMVIGNLKDKLKEKNNISLKQIQDYIKKYIPKIDNWSTCDSFCAGLKITKEYPIEMWDFLQEFLCSKRDYDVRFGIVMIINYYIQDDYLEKIFPIFNQIGESCQTGYVYSDVHAESEQELYYVEMALAWAISICYVYYPDRTMVYLQQMHTETAVLNDFIYNKALQKITESHCVSSEAKAEIRKMKRARLPRSVKNYK